MRTRRDFFRSAGAATMAGVLGFPELVRAHGGASGPSDTVKAAALPTHGQAPPTVATNGYLSALLPLDDQVALRKINARLTHLAIQQCSPEDGVANQILFDTLICESLLAFATHGVGADDLRRLSRDLDVVFAWSLSYGDVRTTFNARFVRMPLAIAFPRTVKDVVFWINFARDHQFSVSIRSGNNCYESFSIDNEIVIDLTFLTLTSSRRKAEQFRLDRKAGVVHVAPGVRLGVLYTELAKHGVTLAAGQCSPVSVRRSASAVWSAPEASALRPAPSATCATSWWPSSSCWPTAAWWWPRPTMTTPTCSARPKGPAPPAWASSPD